MSDHVSALNGCSPSGPDCASSSPSRLSSSSGSSCDCISLRSSLISVCHFDVCHAMMPASTSSGWRLMWPFTILMVVRVTSIRSIGGTHVWFQSCALINTSRIPQPSLTHLPTRRASVSLRLPCSLGSSVSFSRMLSTLLPVLNTCTCWISASPSSGRSSRLDTPYA